MRGYNCHKEIEVYRRTDRVCDKAHEDRSAGWGGMPEARNCNEFAFWWTPIQGVDFVCCNQDFIWQMLDLRPHSALGDLPPVEAIDRWLQRMDSLVWPSRLWGGEVIHLTAYFGRLLFFRDYSIGFAPDYTLKFLSITVALQPADCFAIAIGFSRILNWNRLPIRFSITLAKAHIPHNLSVGWSATAIDWWSHWFIDSLIHCLNVSMAQWLNGSMAQWLNGSIIFCLPWIAQAHLEFLIWCALRVAFIFRLKVLRFRFLSRGC